MSTITTMTAALAERMIRAGTKIDGPYEVSGSLDLRGCDLSGVTLPATVGGWLDLRGAKNPNPAQWWQEQGEIRRRHCIAINDYALIQTDTGRYIAGCRDFDRAQAVEHWSQPHRTDERARLFLAAIAAHPEAAQ